MYTTAGPVTTCLSISGNESSNDIFAYVYPMAGLAKTWHSILEIRTGEDGTNFPTTHLVTAWLNISEARSINNMPKQ